MNRTDRLLAIVLELQGKGHQRAEDLAGTFETSKRRPVSRSFPHRDAATP